MATARMMLLFDDEQDGVAQRSKKLCQSEVSSINGSYQVSFSSLNLTDFRLDYHFLIDQQIRLHLMEVCSLLFLCVIILMNLSLILSNSMPKSFKLFCMYLRSYSFSISACVFCYFFGGEAPQGGVPTRFPKLGPGRKLPLKNDFNQLN